MHTRLLTIALLTLFSFQLLAQSADTAEPKGRPDIPGTFTIDFGFNLPSGDSANFNTGFWGSRTLNLVYQLDKQLGSSKLSFHPGIGLGLERYKFNNENTLVYLPGPTSNFDTLRMLPVHPGMKKSQLITNYLDAVVEFKYSTNPTDPARSFKVGLAFKAGVLIDSFTKLKYREEGETKKLKDNQNWNVNPFRYGAMLRISIGNFSWYGYYSLTPIFEEGKGPDQAELTNFTVGISLGGF